MKKTILMAGIATSLFAFNANALDFTPYVSVKATYTDFDTDLTWYNTWDNGESKYNETYDISDKSWGGSIALGSSIQLYHSSIRTELEYNKKADIESSFSDFIGDTYKTKIETQSFMFNAYYDINTGTNFTPYIGGGVGCAQIKAQDQYWSEFYGDIKDTVFSWQVGAGISYSINDNFVVDAGYRYIDFGNLSEKQTFDNDWGSEKDEFDISANEFYLGLRYQF
ncbi:MAG: porin family protein [Alphaproteobacteria bacterium]|nr:porin family protein [Alphaproteobacteria bacterium]